MAFANRKHSYAVFAVSLGMNWFVVGCEKSASPAASTDSTKSNTSTDTDTDTSDDGGEEAGGEEGNDFKDGTDPVTDGSFDLCGGLDAKKSAMSGFSSYIEELCGKGTDQDRISGLRNADNVYKGSGNPKILSKSDNGDGSSVAVRIFTSTIVEAKAVDYFAMIRLQVSKPDAFAANYEHDDAITMSEVDAKSSSSSFHYLYDNSKSADENKAHDGVAEYKATARFFALKKGTAYVSATTLDESIETVKQLKGLIIVNQKDATHSEVFTMSDQTYEVSAGQEPEVYKTSALSKAGDEQKRMFKNAKTADGAAALLK